MPELLAAVRALTIAVERLEKTLHDEYPKRSEIERRFVTEESSKKRRNRAIGLVVVFVISTVILSYIVTVSTISTCFLGNSSLGQPPHICSVLPGYDFAQHKNRVILKQFKHLISVTDKNEREIKRLERRLH